MEKKRFHVLGLARGITSKTFSTCPFTHNTLGLCEMLSKRDDFEVIHYGTEGSEVVCDEHVDVLSLKEMKECFGDDFMGQKIFNPLGSDNYAGRIFDIKTAHEVKKRANPNDFLCLMAGIGHGNVTNALVGEGVIPCEPAVGYPTLFCHNRVFPSNAWRSFIYGQFHTRWENLDNETKKDPNKWGATVSHYGSPKWQDTVIPHYLDMDEFDYNGNQGDYLVNVSRIVPSKGIEMAIKVTEHLDLKLKLAGQGDFRQQMGFDPPKHVEIVGPVGPEKRSELIGGALAGFALAQYVEPFGLYAIEYGACGTPVIATDWGAFHENIVDEVSGYRINGFQECIDAVKNIDKIDRSACRKYIEDNFSYDIIAPKYHKYFERLYKVHDSFTNMSKGIYYLDEDFEQV